MHTSLKCVNIPNIINYMCSELVAKLSTQFTLYKPYKFSTFLYFFILAFLLESINTFLSFRYIFHLLIDYLSIYQNTTQSRAKKDIRRNFIVIKPRTRSQFFWHKYFSGPMEIKMMDYITWKIYNKTFFKKK